MSGTDSFMIVSFPWYDFNETSGFLDHLWSRLRQYCADLDFDEMPVSLDRKTQHFESLVSQNLILTQTCGYDIAVGIPGPLKLIATPIYRTEGASGGYYSSFLVSRKNSKIKKISTDLANQRFVANDSRSFSGFHCARELVSSVDVRWSGGHLQSIEMINTNQADWAAIDVITWGLLKKFRPQALSELEIFAQTRRVVAPPLVTCASTPDHKIQKIQMALRALCRDAMGSEILNQLLISGFCDFSKEQYRDSIMPKSPVFFESSGCEMLRAIP